MAGVMTGWRTAMDDDEGGDEEDAMDSRREM